MPDKEITVSSTSDTQAEAEQAAWASAEDLATGQLPEAEERGPNYSATELAEMATSHRERLAAEFEINPHRAELAASVSENEWVPEVLILEQENSANVILHLTENPQELRRLQELWKVSPARARDWVGTLSARLGEDGQTYREFQQQREKEERRRRRDR